MSATLGDPYLLATYGLPSISRKGKGKEVAVDERPFVFASHSSVPKHNDGQVTLAVQGNGIHVFELGDLHPVSSHTLGPSTSFASASATIVCTDGEESVRRTYVAIQSAQELKNKDAGRVIWAWKEQVSADIGSSQDRQSTKLPHDIAYLLAPQDLNSVIAVACSGRFTQTDMDLSVQNTWSPKDGTEKVTKLFVFPRRDCKFIPLESPSIGCVMVMFVERDEKLFLQIVAFGLQGKMVVLDQLNIPLGEMENVVDISCEPSGVMSVLVSNGTWTPYTLELRNGSTNITPGSNPLHLKTLIFTTEKNRAPSSQVSLLSLGSSFVLLAGTTSKEIVLLLWDIQYAVLLRSTSLQVPSALENSAHGLSVHLTKGSASQALLVLSPITENLKRNNQLRSSVLLVPFSVPKRSTIADAMGKAAQGVPWLATTSSIPSGSALTPRDGDAHGREAMLAELRDAIKEKPKNADKIFFHWVKWRGGKTKRGVHVSPASEIDDGEPQDVEMAEEHASRALETRVQEVKKPSIRSLFDHGFVVRILLTMLNPDGPPIKHYSPKICRYLVTKSLVSHSMVKGGLLWTLVQHNDWETICECFVHVVDLPEDEMMRVLHIVVRHHHPTAGKNATASDQQQKKKKPQAQVQSSGVPSVGSFLAHIVEYPASPAAWRTALREHFADVDDLMSLLVITEDWLREFMTKDVPFTLGEVTVNEHGVPVPDQVHTEGMLRTKGPLLPSMENVLSFIQAILDSSFLNLLQNPASHVLLQRLAESIAPILTENLELEGLRGPLAPFARAQSKAVAEAGVSGKKRDDVDWRKRRKQAQQQAAINLGPYQVEELVF